MTHAYSNGQIFMPGASKSDIVGEMRVSGEGFKGGKNTKKRDVKKSERVQRGRKER